eukprot:SAG31_NODE_35942_length_318_cov_0.707763_1_plen_44_part_01
MHYNSIISQLRCRTICPGASWDDHDQNRLPFLAICAAAAAAGAG